MTSLAVSVALCTCNGARYLPRRLGITRNFKQAARACRHGLVTLSDQDDCWHPNRLRRMAEAFAARPQLLLLNSGARLVDAQGAKRWRDAMAKLVAAFVK